MTGNVILQRRIILAESLLAKIPVLAISGEGSAVEMILYEVLTLLMKGIGADIGQINLLPKGGRVEKLCIVKNGQPWLQKGMGLHLFDPSMGFTGLVMSTRQTVLVRDIWAEGTEEDPNPFLKMLPMMNARYLKEIKRPVASIMILPIKRGKDIFCTIELSRYREQIPFGAEDRDLVDGFAQRYGSLIMDYILDVRNRISINIAHEKLVTLARLIASNSKVDYRDAIEAYRNLSAADIGFAFFKAGGLRTSSYRLVCWHGEQVLEVFLPEFVPSGDSILLDNPDIAFPLEGEEGDRRMKRFQLRIEAMSELKEEERRFIIKCIRDIRSYVAHNLHMLNQDLGAVVLGSHRPRFWGFLHMNPFLALYNALLKSFLLNEKVVHHLSNISLQIHNPGFYCLSALKGILIQKHAHAFADVEVLSALDSLERLLIELHEQGKALKCRQKNISFLKWIKLYINQKSHQYSSLELNLDIKSRKGPDCFIKANDEQLETIFDNLFFNSRRAIHFHQQQNPSMIGRIDITVKIDKKTIKLLMQDNGSAYVTVSGRGLPQIKNILRELDGKIRRFKHPYRTYLSFPYTIANK